MKIIKRTFEWYTHNTISFLWFISFMLLTIIFGAVIASSEIRYLIIILGLMIICLIFWGVSSIKEFILEQKEKEIN